MYQRLMNKLDVMIFKREMADMIPEEVIEHICEQIEVLDNIYGSYRGSKDMGGYILFFQNNSIHKALVAEVLDFYNLDSELYEYSDEICNCKNQIWKEKLYMLGSDDALVLVYPTEECDVREE